jgi:hypothetical protein
MLNDKTLNVVTGSDTYHKKLICNAKSNVC